MNPILKQWHPQPDNAVRIVNDAKVRHIVQCCCLLNPITNFWEVLGRELSDNPFVGRDELLQYIKNPWLKDVEYTSER